MKARKSIRIVVCFVCLAIQILLPVDSFPSRSQGQNNLPGLEGTRWASPLLLNGGLAQVVEYRFHKSGKVEMVVYIADAVGIPDRIQHNTSGPGRPEEERGRAVLVPGIAPPQTVDMKSETGTYKQNGNSINLEFSGQKIKAIIRDNRMEGEVIKGDAKEKWLVIKGSEGSHPSFTSPGSAVPVRQEDLKLRSDATYTVTASEVIIVDRLNLRSGPFTVNASMKITSMDNNRNVRAEVSIGGRKGMLLGRIDAVNGLQLTGMLVDSYNATHEATLIATVKEGSLTTMKYVLRSGATRVTGEFQF